MPGASWRSCLKAMSTRSSPRKTGRGSSSSRRGRGRRCRSSCGGRPSGKIDRLSGLITESFRFLLAEEVDGRADPDRSGDVCHHPVRPRGTALAKERLSEGEKQIFAISVLWGLARASSRPLPAVIDTPMARLDATHRRNLVERYFPNASHQVVILSTDTEVDRDYYQALQPHIARAYHLNYDEDAPRDGGRRGLLLEGRLPPAGSGVES